MAIASSSIDFNFKTNEKGTSQNKLDFYESMYHFKKMFPKFDSEVIETVLRSNNGSVDKTLDHLLSLSVDSEETISHNNTPQPSSCILTSPLDEPLLNESHDLPPSYNEIMSSSSISENSTDKNKDLIDFNNNNVPDTQIRSCLNSVQSEPKLNANHCLNSTYHSSPAFIRNFNQILIGDLSKDFLRIKLTKDQVNAYKSSIKVAKREEITALLNNVILKKSSIFKFDFFKFAFRKLQNIRNCLSN